MPTQSMCHCWLQWDMVLPYWTMGACDSLPQTNWSSKVSKLFLYENRRVAHQQPTAPTNTNTCRRNTAVLYIHKQMCKFYVFLITFLMRHLGALVAHNSPTRHVVMALSSDNILFCRGFSVPFWKIKPFTQVCLSALGSPIKPHSSKTLAQSTVLTIFEYIWNFFGWRHALL